MSSPHQPPLPRRLLAELLGTALLVAVVVGSGIAAQQLSPGDVGLQLLENSTRHLLAEVVATTFLVALIFALARSDRGALAAPAVGAYIGAAYWFTSSTSFANPAVTVGRVLTDTFAGIAPSSALPFVVAQLAGLAVGVVVVLALYPDAGTHADGVVVPQHADFTVAPDHADASIASATTHRSR